MNKLLFISASVIALSTAANASPIGIHTPHTLDTKPISSFKIAASYFLPEYTTPQFVFKNESAPCTSYRSNCQPSETSCPSGSHLYIVDDGCGGTCNICRTCSEITCNNGSEKCVNGQCVAQNCSDKPSLCSDKQKCVNGTCVAKTCFDITCLSGQKCEATTLSCVKKTCPSDITCPTGSICKDGTCVNDSCPANKISNCDSNNNISSACETIDSGKKCCTCTAKNCINTANFCPEGQTCNTTTAKCVTACVPDDMTGWLTEFMPTCTQSTIDASIGITYKEIYRDDGCGTTYHRCCPTFNNSWTKVIGTIATTDRYDYCNDVWYRQENCPVPEGSGWTKIITGYPTACTTTSSPTDGSYSYEETADDGCGTSYHRCCTKYPAEFGWADITSGNTTTIPSTSGTTTVPTGTGAGTTGYWPYTETKSSCDHTFSRTCLQFSVSDGWTRVTSSSTPTPTPTPTTSTTVPGQTTSTTTAGSGIITNTETISDNCGSEYSRSCSVPKENHGYIEVASACSKASEGWLTYDPNNCAIMTETTYDCGRRWYRCGTTQPVSTTTSTTTSPTVTTGTTNIPITPHANQATGCQYGESKYETFSSCGRTFERVCNIFNSSEGWYNPNDGLTHTTCTAANFISMEDGCGTTYNCCKKSVSCTTPPSGYSTNFPSSCSGDIKYWVDTCIAYYMCITTTTPPDTGSATTPEVATGNYTPNCETPPSGGCSSGTCCAGINCYGPWRLSDSQDGSGCDMWYQKWEYVNACGNKYWIRCHSRKP